MGEICWKPGRRDRYQTAERTERKFLVTLSKGIANRQGFVRREPVIRLENEIVEIVAVVHNTGHLI